MGLSDLDPGARGRRPWNAGTLVGAKRPLKARDVWAIRFFLDEHGRVRDRALFDLALDSKLRGCDLVKLAIGDLVAGTSIRTRAAIIQQKTGKPVQFELMTDARRALEAWLDCRRGCTSDFVFPSRVDYRGHLSTRQYARLVHEWVTAIGLDPTQYGTHSLRRTKASMIYKRTGTCARYRSCWVTAGSRTPSVTSGSTSMMHSRSLSERKSDAVAPCPRGATIG